MQPSKQVHHVNNNLANRANTSNGLFGRINIYTVLHMRWNYTLPSILNTVRNILHSRLLIDPTLDWSLGTS